MGRTRLTEIVNLEVTLLAKIALTAIAPTAMYGDIVIGHGGVFGPTSNALSIRPTAHKTCVNNQVESFSKENKYNNNNKKKEDKEFIEEKKG